MTGRPNPGRRAELLAQILGYLETHALSSISMRRLAQALGVSTFTLTYQFNNQEELMDAIGVAVSKKLSGLSEVFDSMPDSVFAYAEGFRKFWQLARSEEYSAYIRLEMESSMLDVLDPQTQSPCGQARRLWRRRSADAMISLGVPLASAAVEAEVNQATVFGLLYAAISSPDEGFSDAFEYALAAHIERIADLVDSKVGAGGIPALLSKASD